jgi:hypothetical protein
MDTYRISTWDSEEDGWTVEFRGLTKWQIREKLRYLYSWAYSQASILVEAETHIRPAKRWERGFVSRTELPRRIRRKLIGAT